MSPEDLGFRLWWLRGAERHDVQAALLAEPVPTTEDQVEERLADRMPALAHSTVRQIAESFLRP